MIRAGERDHRRAVAARLAQRCDGAVHVEQQRALRSERTMLCTQKNDEMRTPRITGRTWCTLVPG